MFTVSLILLIGIDACGHVHNCVKTAVVQSSETIHAWLQSSCPSGGKQKIFPNFLKSSERRSIFTVLFKTSSKFEMKPFFITFKDPTISSSFHFLVLGENLRRFFVYQVSNVLRVKSAKYGNM